MNPLTNIKNINKLNELEAEYGISSKQSWHQQYKDSAYIYIGGLPFDLTEGDVLCIFSQYGEIVNINLVRDKKTGKSQGFCFIAYEDQRSTILAVDNLNGFKILGRTIRVDHVNEYRAPKENDNDGEELQKLHKEGCAPKIPSPVKSEDEELLLPVTKIKKEKLKKSKKAKKKKKKKKDSSSGSSDDSEEEQQRVKIKQEKYDPGYDRQEYNQRSNQRQVKSEHNERLSDLRYNDDERKDDMKRRKGGYSVNGGKQDYDRYSREHDRRERNDRDQDEWNDRETRDTEGRNRKEKSREQDRVREGRRERHNERNDLYSNRRERSRSPYMRKNHDSHKYSRR
ncbi:uncharacterized protein [Antedon mediterranea]|uniref:uncharacterized protein n=1 Tax=Antedon mediterranea TaxID=105859 RepID=UPI003AF42BF0